MDRMEEYTALLRDLEELPPALAGTVGRAKARRRRLRLRPRPKIRVIPVGQKNNLVRRAANVI